MLGYWILRDNRNIRIVRNLKRILKILIINRLGEIERKQSFFSICCNKFFTFPHITCVRTNCASTVDIDSSATRACQISPLRCAKDNTFLQFADGSIREPSNSSIESSAIYKNRIRPMQLRSSCINHRSKLLNGHEERNRRAQRR